MSSFIKKVSVFVICCTVVSMASVGAYAASVAYNTSTYRYVASLANDTASAKTISANTRPSVGNGGAVINITKSDGTVKASKSFPYYVSVSALTANFPSSSVRRIQVGPQSSNQRIEGTVSYSVK